MKVNAEPVSTKAKAKPACSLCNGKHELNVCQAFQSKSLSDRKAFVRATVVCKVICQVDADKERNVLFVQSFLFCFVCCFMSQVNSYGHGGTVSSPNHTFFLGKLEQAVNQYFEHIHSLVTDNNPS